MKTHLFIIFLLFCSSALFAQTNDFVVYSEKGEEFTLYVNSVKQNDPPAANVRARDITGESFTVRVQFADTQIPDVTTRYWTEAKNVDITLVVKQNNKGKWVINTHGETPRVYQPQGVIVHHIPPPPPPPPHQHGHHHTGSVSMQINDGGEYVNMNVAGGSINIQANDGYESVNVNMSVNTNFGVTTSVTTTSTEYGNPYPGGHTPPASRCPYPMSPADFKQALNTIQYETYENTKITLAKQVCRSSCMTAEQLRTVMKSFTYETSRLEIAKYAYDYVFDPERYYLINDAFEYSSSVDELNRYFQSR